MSSKAISEVSGKRLLNENMSGTVMVQCKCASYTVGDDWDKIVAENSWLKSEKLVAKADQLIKRRGKLQLVCVGKSLTGIKDWIEQKANKRCLVGATEGRLHTFIMEPFVPHTQTEEMYICISSGRAGDTILFYHEGGVDIGDVDAVATSYLVPTGESVNPEVLEHSLLRAVPAGKIKFLVPFLVELYRVYVDLHFTYLEINPLVVTDTQVYVLDLAAKLDQTADFICATKWVGAEFPPPFGRDAYPEEKYIAELDAKSGASLKLTILNKEGRVWTMVAGGGASVVYTDTICDLGGAGELANYGEYSGAPTESQTKEYAKTIFGLMCATPHPLGKVLIIGGGIANFTNIADTFRGIISAIDAFKDKLRENHVTIFVRRGGPNYQEGLRQMREVGQRLSIPLYVFGPEAHMTHICRYALGHEAIPQDMIIVPGAPAMLPQLRREHITDNGDVEVKKGPMGKRELDTVCERDGDRLAPMGEELFNDGTKSIVWGMQNRAIQNMLDFDYVCSRKEPSVVAVVYPFTSDHKQKFYFGNKEIFVPVYSDLDNGFTRHPEATVLINFASLRSAYDSTLQAMMHPRLRTVVIIAEGIPENMTRKLIKAADNKKVTIIGPATVGGIKPGCFKIGNTAGMIDNIVESKLFRPGSVAYVSKSGGMSNELNNIISKETDGVYEGVAIGGDRYPASTFLDHLIRYEKDPKVKMMVLLGEVGGVEEYHVCRAILEKRLTKPLVAWCIGTCSSMFTSEVQFGHAGSCAGSKLEEASAKNSALARHGARVPSSFDTLGAEIGAVYNELVRAGKLKPTPDVQPPKLPMDYDWAMKLGLIRKPANFISTICDERGKELTYSGVPISQLAERPNGIGLTLSLLWFQRELPSDLCRFLEMCLVITADHGPAVSGAHNTMVCARAGKDLVSSVVSGLLTIGDRFGGALDKAAQDFGAACASGVHPMDFVTEKRAKGELIMGIGHRIKSINNPDERVSCLRRYIQRKFPRHPTVEYALAVEAITTRKKPNLILNVDGIIAAAFVDLFRHSGQFTSEEADQYIKMGSINALFVLGRTIGLVGHFLDQNRLQQPLYRHPWDDITYMPRD